MCGAGMACRRLPAPRRVACTRVSAAFHTAVDLTQSNRLLPAPGRQSSRRTRATVDLTASTLLGGAVKSTQLPSSRLSQVDARQVGASTASTRLAERSRLDTFAVDSTVRRLNAVDLTALALPTYLLQRDCKQCKHCRPLVQQRSRWGVLQRF